MTSSLDELLNAEFKEAFDEFDKVNKLARFSSLAKESLVEKRSQPFFPQITLDSSQNVIDSKQCFKKGRNRASIIIPPLLNLPQACHLACF